MELSRGSASSRDTSPGGKGTGSLQPHPNQQPLAQVGLLPPRDPESALPQPPLLLGKKGLSEAYLAGA